MASINKIITGSVSKFKQIIPENASTYKLVTGNGAKGKFSVLSFFDKNENLVARRSIFKNGSDVSQINQNFYTYGEDVRLTFREEFLNNNLTKTSEIETIWDKTGNSKDLWKFEKDFYSNADHHKVSYLSPGQTPKSLEYYTSWDGNKPSNIVLKGIDKAKMPQKNLEYLPLYGDCSSMSRIDARVDHLRRINENKYNIKGLFPEVRRLSEEELSYISRGKPLGLGDFNGQMILNSNLWTSRDLVEVVGHEARHEFDYVLFNRLQKNVENNKVLPNIFRRFCYDKGAIKFSKECQKGNIISNKSNLGKRVKDYQEKWDTHGNKAWKDRAEEQRAIHAQKAELTKYDRVVDKICNAVDAKFRPSYAMDLYA